MKKFINESWLVLTMGVVFACLLAGTQTTMQPLISANQTAELNQAIGEVVSTLDPVSKPEKSEIDGNAVYKCLAEDGTLAGWAVDAEGGGFVDKIRVVVGLSPTGDRVLGIKVIDHKETPGLGNKIDTKGEENFYPLQYQGKSAAEPLTLVKGAPTDPQQLQAITGATYSSQYVMDIVNDVVARIVPQLPQE